MAKTRTLGPGSLKIGASGSEQDFSADVINTALEPSTDTEDNDNFLDGHTEGGSQTETWALTGSIKEDFSMNGLQVWCLKNSGKTLPFEWVPNLEAVSYTHLDVYKRQAPLRSNLGEPHWKRRRSLALQRLFPA